MQLGWEKFSEIIQNLYNVLCSKKSIQSFVFTFKYSNLENIYSVQKPELGLNNNLLL